MRHLIERGMARIEPGLACENGVQKNAALRVSAAFLLALTELPYGFLRVFRRSGQPEKPLTRFATTICFLYPGATCR